MLFRLLCKKNVLSLLLAATLVVSSIGCSKVESTSTSTSNSTSISTEPLFGENTAPGFEYKCAVVHQEKRDVDMSLEDRPYRYTTVLLLESLTERYHFMLVNAVSNITGVNIEFEGGSSIQRNSGDLCVLPLNEYDSAHDHAADRGCYILVIHSDRYYNVDNLSILADVYYSVPAADGEYSKIEDASYYYNQYIEVNADISEMTTSPDYVHSINLIKVGEDYVITAPSVEGSGTMETDISGVPYTVNYHLIPMYPVIATGNSHISKLDRDFITSVYGTPMQMKEPWVTYCQFNADANHYMVGVGYPTAELTEDLKRDLESYAASVGLALYTDDGIVRLVR